MPHGFEYVVRPFASPGSLGNVIIPGTPERTQEQAHITWGAVGTMPTTNVLNPSSVVNTKTEDLTEQNRDSDIERIPIQGSEDDSYVEVARAKQVRLDKQETVTPEQKLSFYAGGPTISQALADHLDSFTAVNNAVAEKIANSKVTWNMKNE
jgi:hypothetical protein